MYTVFAQPKYAMMKPTDAPIGYELFIRVWRDGQWDYPRPFELIGVVTLNRLLRQAIAAMPPSIELLSFNLEQAQFIDPAFTSMIASVQRSTSIRLYTELTERLGVGVTATQLLAAAKRFAACGLAVCIDDVGTGQNSPALVMMLNDYIAEYKFAFQNFRPLDSVTVLKPQLEFWTGLAQRQRKLLAWEGIESTVELALLQARFPGDLLQGFLFAKQARLETVAYTPQSVSGDR
ncbi:EAL domain-containing protein [Lacticaseibacillus baoqingensis]|uniref:EAL domain-containing protein n=1 Tax=Lacticaseibacillus baoqingensis TaxID=2486013 RepID=A0ABW4E2K5_9LACO|nr:EAL domain-containing protein [Lacticaseibacillus baoqingensis]